MFIPRLYLFRYLAILLLALMIAASFYALAAGHSLDQSGAGDGAAAITPYLVDSNSIRYTLDFQARPTDIKKVQFEVLVQTGSSAAPPSEVHARLDNGNWVSCAWLSGASWSCSFGPPYPQVKASPPNILEIVAAQ